LDRVEPHTARISHLLMSASSSQTHLHTSMHSHGGQSQNAPETVTNTDSADPFPRETRFYQTRIDFFADDVINAVDDYLCDGMDSLEKSLVQNEGFSERKVEIAQSVDKLFSTLEKRTSENFDKFEMILFERTDKKGIVLLPENLVLPHEEKDHSLPEADALNETELDSEIIELHRKLHAARYLNQAMRTELDHSDQELSKYHEISSLLDFDSRTQKALCDVENISQDVKTYIDEIRSLKEVVQAHALDVSDIPVPSFEETIAADKQRLSSSSDVQQFASSLSPS